MERELYLKAKKEEKKSKIRRLFDVFFKYDGDYQKIADEIGCAKGYISLLIKDKVIYEMIDDGELDINVYKKMLEQVKKNIQTGRKKGGDNFKENYDVEFDEKHRIIGHSNK